MISWRYTRYPGHPRTFVQSVSRILRSVPRVPENQKPPAIPSSATQSATVGSPIPVASSHVGMHAGEPDVTHVLLRSGRWTEKVLARSEEHTSELQSRENLVCRLLLEKKKKKRKNRMN